MKVLMFDLGGVLVEIEATGFQWLLELSNLKEKEFWERFLNSPNVHDIETGKIDIYIFAQRFMEEFNFDIDMNDFIGVFASLPHRKYKGVDEMLKELSANFTLVCLSNTSRIYVNKLLHNFEFEKLFDYCFLSSEIGISKPSEEVFQYVKNQLKCEYNEISFFDDNYINVNMASSLGINAYVVKGFDDLKNKLNELDIYSI